MEVAMAAVCDAANISIEGKLNATGIFDTIYSMQEPAVHPQLAFAFRIKLESDDTNKKHEFDVTLIDQDSRVLWGARAGVDVGRIPPGQFTHSNQVISLQNVRFPKWGRYRFRVAIRGRAESFDCVFQVAKAPVPPATPEA